MIVKCKTPEELGKAIKNQEEFIEIEGDLKNKVIRIKATGKVAWGVCAVALGAAIVIWITTPEATAAATVLGTPVGGAAEFVSSFAATVTATTVVSATLGTATIAAVMIGVAAGGIGALNTLRDTYKIVEKDDKHIKLQRK